MGGGGRVSFLLLLLLLSISTCHPGLRQSTGFNNAFEICTCCCFIRQLHVRHKCMRIYGLFKDAIIYQTVQHRIVEWILNSELQKMWKEAAMHLYEVTSWNISEWNHEKLYWVWPKQKCSLLTASSMERDTKSVLCKMLLFAFKLTNFTVSNFCLLLSTSRQYVTVDWSRRYKPQDINLFKPSGYYVYQQVWYSKTLHSFQRLYLCPSYDSHNEATFPIWN